MNNQRRISQPIAWAWAAGWALASLGMVISDIYSNPNRGWAAFYGLGLAGWAVGALVTIGTLRKKLGANAYGTALSAFGWVLGALIAIPVGLIWLQSWDAGFWGPIVAAAIGGTIGGAFTLPLLSKHSFSKIVRLSLRGALSWGLMFLVFQTLAFYAGYILSNWTIYKLAPTLGDPWAAVPGWVVPAAVCGLLAALHASMSLPIVEQGGS